MKNYSAYKNLKAIVVSTLYLLLLNGCEDVITLELDNAEPQTVIEGKITDEPGPYTVEISKSTDFFQPGVYEKVSNAVVKISDNLGNVDHLIEQEPGVYYTTNFQTIYDNEYYLEVINENNQYDATTILVTPLSIDSLSYAITKDAIEISIHFQDYPDKRDFAIINFKINDGDFQNYFILYNDRLSNGNYIKYPIYSSKDSLKYGDTFKVIMRTIDVEAYNYYNALNEVLATTGTFTGLSPTAPENPKSNLSNGALGYFGAYSISRKSVVIED